MDIKFYNEINAVGESLWNSIAGSDYPFINFHFLAALEYAGDHTSNKQGDTEEGRGKFVACNKASGWQPYHIVVFDNDKPIAVMPNYIKYHSYGEYIFDWSWADAYQRNGFNYYPKMFSGIPYSPVSGERLATNDNNRISEIVSAISHALRDKCIELNLSSFHLLFPEKKLSSLFAENQITQRLSFQYHWLNKDKNEQPFESFDDFLNMLKSRKKKELRKERKVIRDQNIDIIRLTGDAIQPEHWEKFYQFYQSTYAKRSGHGGYLPRDFFYQVGKKLKHQILLVLAMKKKEVIAGALNFFSSSTLYGRYWGCNQEAEFLHFEVCYYQGIEFCIENQLTKFDAGAQGEHKIQRGFRPITTWSNHWIANEKFGTAIDSFIEEERNHNLAYITQAQEMLPFKQT